MVQEVAESLILYSNHSRTGFTV